MADLTKDEARDELRLRAVRAAKQGGKIPTNIVDAVLAAPPEVLAAAMGPDRLRELLRHVA